MKKLLIAAAILLFIGSFAIAANIPIVDPETDPKPVITAVYNPGASSIAAGQVVCWAGDGSTGDDKNHIDTTCGTDAWHVAGVVYPSAIGATSSGTIAIYGVASVSLRENVAAKTMLCATSTAGKASACAERAYAFGETTEAGSSNAADTMLYVSQVGSNIPRAVDPINGPEVWTVPVYSASEVQVGDVVVWTVDDSSGDNDYWVENTTTEATGSVAGIVFPATISAGGTGAVAVRGIVTGNTVVTPHGAGTIAAGDLICTANETANIGLGAVEVCTPANAPYAIGYATADESGNSVLMYLNP